MKHIEYSEYYFYIGNRDDYGLISTFDQILLGVRRYGYILSMADAVGFNTEIRKLKPAELYKLGQMLNVSDSWKRLMAAVPKEGSVGPLRFNSEHISMIDQAVLQQKRSAAEIFLEEWSTMGRRRPTLGILLQLLVEVKLFRAADYVAGDILKDELPKRPENGPVAPVNISDEALAALLTEECTTHDAENCETPVIVGSSSEIEISNIVCGPEVLVNDVGVNKANISTKLASNGEHPTHVSKKDISDLIKFSNSELPVNTDQSSDRCSPAFVCQANEVVTQELPLCINESQKTGEGSYKTKSDVSTSSNTASQTKTSYVSSDESSSVVSNNSEHTELSSNELPQCIVELESSRHGTRSESIVTNALNDTLLNTVASEELPVTLRESR